MTSLRKGGALSLSLNLNFNTKSSTLVELVGSHDGLSVFLWMKNLINAQSYNMEHNKLYSDNKSNTLIENNGGASRSKII